MITKDLQPKTRQRSLALIQSLNKVLFDGAKTVTEQLPQYDLMVREYERVQTRRTRTTEDCLGVVSLARHPQASHTDDAAGRHYV